MRSRPRAGRATFEALLDRAITEGEPSITCTTLHPAALCAIDNIAHAWPDLAGELITKARKAFYRYEER